MANSESTLSKIIVGVSVPVISTIILVYIGFKPGSNATAEEDKKPTKTETIFTPSTYSGEEINNEQPTKNQTTTNYPVSPPSFKPLVFGKYMGSCYNETVMQEAQVTLTIEHQPSGKVVGNIHIYGELAGTNTFEGFLEGNELSFITADTSTGISISWEGVVQGNFIYGDYYVSMPDIYKMQGYIDQYGTWSVSK